MKQDHLLSPSNKGLNPALVLRGVGIVTKLLIFGSLVQLSSPIPSLAQDFPEDQSYRILTQEEADEILEESLDLTDSPPLTQGKVGSDTEKSFSIGVDSKALADSAFAIGEQATAGGPNTAAIGFRASANGNSAVALGKDAEADGHISAAIGTGAKSSQVGAVAIGLGSLAGGYKSIALGSGTLATGKMSTAIGVDARASAIQSTAIGLSSEADGINATAVGVNAQARADKTFAVALALRLLAIWPQPLAQDLLPMAMNRSPLVPVRRLLVHYQQQWVSMLRPLMPNQLPSVLAPRPPTIFPQLLVLVHLQKE